MSPAVLTPPIHVYNTYNTAGPLWLGHRRQVSSLSQGRQTTKPHTLTFTSIGYLESPTHVSTERTCKLRPERPSVPEIEPKTFTYLTVFSLDSNLKPIMVQV